MRSANGEIVKDDAVQSGEGRGALIGSWHTVARPDRFEVDGTREELTHTVIENETEIGTGTMVDEVEVQTEDAAVTRIDPGTMTMRCLTWSGIWRRTRMKKKGKFESRGRGE